MKEYLGDGVYIEKVGDSLGLSLRDFYSSDEAIHTIQLCPTVQINLIKFFERMIRE